MAEERSEYEYTFWEAALIVAAGVAIGVVGIHLIPETIRAVH